MNITDMLGTPVNDPVETHSVPTPNCATAEAPQPAPPPPTSRVRPVVIAAIVAALMVGIGAGRYFGGAAAPPTPILADTYPPTAQIGDYAQMYVARHLSGRTASDGATGTWVNHSATSLVEPLGNGFWEAIVAVDALELVDGFYEPIGLQYFSVTIDAHAVYPIAVSAPSRIPEPAVSTPSNSFTNTVPADQAAAITQFLAAYLTGSKEAARYTTPTANIPRFATPPYASAEVTSMNSDPLGRVSASVAATTTAGAIHPLQYFVVTSLDGGVWQVSGITAPTVAE